MEKILVIEDELVVRENLQTLLDRVGYNVITAENGTIGIRLARENKPDLIICDILMPDITGFDVINLLSKDVETSIIPFIFLTAKAEMEDLREGMRRGADDYLTKPYTAGDLLNAINSRLEKREKLIKGIEKGLVNNISPLSNNARSGHIFVQKGDQAKLLKIEEISHIKVLGIYTEIYSINKEKFLIRKPLKNWIDFLPQDKFIRIHQSVIINLDRIRKIEEWFNSTYKVFLIQVEEPIISSRRYGAKLRAIIKKTF